MKDNHNKLTPVQFQQAQELFAQAIQLPSEEHQSWLSQQADIDTVVINKVRQLLRHSNASIDDDQSISSPAIDVFELALIQSDIGSYQLVKSLGEGGMGRVYLARRNDQAFDKDVVIKLMKGFHKKDSALQRFHFERQVLAQMEHPNIARLLDGGECQDGTPFYVMEYVDGYSITDYCSKHQLNLKQRLKLFQKVCSAVQYAHQNLIIHRDLKPANILINSYGEPKLLDFGIAKRITNDNATVGQTTTHMMTPAYSSPEQLLGQHLTTTSDIYSLGVVLFEILTGRNPYDDHTNDPIRLKAAICEYQPRTPSKQQNSIGRKLNWSSDLDSIVLKTLSKETTRRYSSALQLSDDLQRYLDGHPVSASRNTWLYRGRKLLSRHRWVAVGVVLALSLFGWQQARVLQQRDQAQLNAGRAEQNRDFLIGMFDTIDPTIAQYVDISAKTILDHGAQQLDDGLIDEPEMQIELMVTLASLYQEHGLFSEASKHAKKAVNIGRNLYSNEHLKLAKVLNTLASIYLDQAYYDDALPTAQEALNIFKSEHQEQNESLARSLHLISLAYFNTGQINESQKASLQSVAIAKRPSSGNPQLLADALSTLAASYIFLHEHQLAQQNT